MPFDGIGWEKARAAALMDQVIDLIGTEDRWCQFTGQSWDRQRRCIYNAIYAVGGVEVLDKPVSLAIAQVTGRPLFTISIPEFNDHKRTTHALVMRVLRQARANILRPDEQPPAPPAPLFAWLRRLFGALVS